MPTNKIVLPSMTQFLADYQMRYSPLYGLLLASGMRNTKYTAEVGSMEFKRLKAIGDIRQHRISPKDTEVKQIAVTDESRVFKKYYWANQYIHSSFQSDEGTQDVTAQVLDEHHVHYDEILVTGDNGVNNGLYNSSDPNYSTAVSIQIASSDRLYDLHAKVITSCLKAAEVDGRKLVLFYGETMNNLVNSLYPATAVPFRKTLSESLSAEFSVSSMPTKITPNGENGWIVINLDQVKYHYTMIPNLMNQGVNDEKMYAWFNFGMGSQMLEVLAKDGIIRQPTTFA